MSKNKTKKVITNVSVALATILAWISGYIVMQIVYHSIAASIIFGTVWAVIVFCESRFSYISLKSDGKIEITKEEIKSNLWQIVASTLVALLVSIPLELKVFVKEMASSHSDLGKQIGYLGDIWSTHWLLMIAFALVIVVIYQIPIFVRMASDD